MINLLRETDCNQENIDALTVEVQRQAQAIEIGSTGDERMRHEFRQIERKVSAGVDRLLDAPDGWEGELAEKLAELKSRRNELQKQLEDFVKPDPAEADRLLKTALKTLESAEALEECLCSADRLGLCRAITRMVSKIELWWEEQEGNARPKLLASQGLVHLCKEMVP